MKTTTYPCPTCNHGTLRVVDAAELRATHERLGLTVRGVAEELGLSPTYISQILNGHKRCPWYVLEFYERLEGD